VIVPAYNVEEYIEETLQSVFDQTYPNIEILVVDDGSEDNTLKTLEKYGSKIRVFQQKNMGVAKARNFAAEQAHGEWLAFVDADDIWLPNKLTAQLEGLGNENWSHTDSTYFGYKQDGETKRSELSPQYGGEVFSYLIVNNFITTSTVLIKKGIFLSYGGFDESLRALEDWKLWLDLSIKEPLNYNRNVLAQYRVTPGSTSRKAREILPLHLQLINYIFSTYKDQLGGLSHLKKKALYSSYSICSYIAEDSEDYFFSFLCALNAWKNNMLTSAPLKRVLRTVLNFFSSN
jgi:glycosyltransferase involved in cell wall biosynthesis